MPASHRSESSIKHLRRTPLLLGFGDQGLQRRALSDSPHHYLADEIDEEWFTLATTGAIRSPHVLIRISSPTGGSAVALPLTATQTIINGSYSPLMMGREHGAWEREMLIRWRLRLPSMHVSLERITPDLSLKFVHHHPSTIFPTAIYAIARLQSLPEHHSSVRILRCISGKELLRPRWLA